jgi:hypothetical protein
MFLEKARNSIENSTENAAHISVVAIDIIEHLARFFIVIAESEIVDGSALESSDWSIFDRFDDRSIAAAFEQILHFFRAGAEQCGFVSRYVIQIGKLVVIIAENKLFEHQKQRNRIKTFKNADEPVVKNEESGQVTFLMQCNSKMFSFNDHFCLGNFLFGSIDH